jgi:YbbR domain-containing protein
VPIVVRHVTGMPASGYAWRGRAWTEPDRVRITGAEQALAAIDSVVVAAVRVDGRRDTVSAVVGFESLPQGCKAEPATVRVHLQLEPRTH